ncbi:GNAT family acetyltransferase [bacterium]|nr:GNAT family acetyltransferase [bacterium]
MQIRPYENEDRDAVIQLWEKCNLTRPWNDPAKDIARKLEVNAELFLVGLIDGKIVATVMGGYDGHRGWMNYLAVDPAHQRRGLAQQIMRAVEERIEAMGCPKINLQIRTDNLAAIRFYESIGYMSDDVVSFGKRLECDD